MLDELKNSCRPVLPTVVLPKIVDIFSFIMIFFVCSSTLHCTIIRKNANIRSKGRYNGEKGGFFTEHRGKKNEKRGIGNFFLDNIYQCFYMCLISSQVRP